MSFAAVDLYGTLAEGGFWRSYKFLLSHGLTASAHEFRTSTETAMGGELTRSPFAHEDDLASWRREGMRLVMTRHGLAKEASSALAVRALEIMDELRPRPGAAEFLRGLRERVERVIICTNADWGARRRFYDSILADYVSGFVSSAECGVRKPNEAIYEEVVRAASAPAGDCTFLGDDLVGDVFAPLVFGMRAIWLGGELDGLRTTASGAVFYSTRSFRSALRHIDERGCEDLCS